MARSLFLFVAATGLFALSAGARMSPAPLQRLVREAFPQWSFQRANVESCGPDARATASGDFNGDGVTDHVARLVRGERGMIVAFISRPRGYRHIVLERTSRSDIMRMFLGVEPRGSRHLVIVGGLRDRRPMVLRHDAPTSGSCEASSFIYLIDGSRFSRAFTSD